LLNGIILLRYGYIALVLFASQAFAQISSIHTIKVLPNQGDSLYLDSVPIIKESVSVSGFTYGNDFELKGNHLIWKVDGVSDSIIVQYRVVDFRITYQHKDPEIIEQVFGENPFSYRPNKDGVKTSYGSLRTQGNVSRGIGFGNAQDVVVNSNLNLRLSGILASDVKVSAVISDENNPIQPEGNTQQIQDFDQVYITLEKGKSKITLGDFLMQNSEESYFVNFYKKSRGLQFTNQKDFNQWEVISGGEAAISRGRFNRNRIEGIEGNSGPYRLSGTNGELFIVVIAGTESIYLDGKLLTRGEDHDYVINYNTGEVIFTPKILITRYSRIVAEFQYSDRNYARSVSHLASSATNGKIKVYANFFNEMDLRSQPFQQSLEGFDSIQNKSAIDILNESGDNQAIFNNVKLQDQYNTNRIMYKKVLVGLDEVYVYATDPSENTTFYEVFFSNLGDGNGSYIQAQTAANGKVFEYVGVGFGNYEPLEVLIAPQKLNTFNVGFVRETKGNSFGMEYVTSSLDKNTLSGLNDNDNTGFGFKVFRRTEQSFKDSSAWKFKSNMNYELVSNQYQYVERYRSVEFDRRWNKVLTNPSSLAQLLPSFEHIANVSLRLEKGNENYIENNAALFNRPESFNGFSNITGGGVEYKGFKINSRFEILSSSLELDSVSTGNNFYSLQSSIEKPILTSIVGAVYKLEQSSFLNADTTLKNSYNFDAMRVYFKSQEKQKLEYNLSIGRRVDRIPDLSEFIPSTIGRDASLSGSYISKKNNRIGLNTTYRQLKVDTATISDDLENKLQSRIELDFDIWKRFIKSRTFYQIGTGQEQRREFQYLQVQAGNGIYIWNDYDTNGVKTLNEFEIASDLDRQRADYIKIYTPVSGFIATHSNKMSQTLELNPAVFYNKSNKSKNKPLYTRFNSISSIILDRKVLPTQFANFINPFEQSLNDTALINSSQNFRTTLFYNRGNAKYSLDYTYINNSSKVLLTNGFDTRKSFDHLVNVRVNLGRIITLSGRAVVGDRLYLSQFFNSRSFNYTFIEAQPKIQFVFNNTYRIELRTKYYLANNAVLYGGEQSENIELGGEFKYTKAGKGSLKCGMSYVKVNYDGVASSTLGYELLRGLQNGNNATWNFGYQRTLANNIQVIVSYDGRKSEEAPVIHIGRVLARYLF
jgi:hypothetical protein